MSTRENELMPRMVYIAGCGRSGSTLLDTLLGNHPAVFGAGEVASIFQEWLRGGRCSCGHSYVACAFWPKVMDRVQAALPGLTPAAAEDISRSVEASISVRPACRGNRRAQRELFGKLWRAVMLSMSQESGKQIIVDSSKSTRYVSRRIAALTRLCGFEVRVLHLVRDPRAFLWSALRGSNRLLEAGQRGMLKGGVCRALVGWLMANASVHMTKATNPQVRVMHVRYEDLVGDPVHTLHDVGMFLDLDLQPVIGLVVNDQPMAPGHGVGGNRMRRQGAIRLVADEEWKNHLPGYGRALARLSWPLARQYGYDVLSNGCR